MTTDTITGINGFDEMLVVDYLEQNYPLNLQVESPAAKSAFLGALSFCRNGALIELWSRLYCCGEIAFVQCDEPAMTYYRDGDGLVIECGGAPTEFLAFPVLLDIACDSELDWRHHAGEMLQKDLRAITRLVDSYMEVQGR